MALYALGDLHLSLNSNKSMEIFGDGWQDYVSRLKEAFSALRPEDVTVLCGDLSWGMSLEESLEDFRFIDALPGKKYLLKGNQGTHDEKVLLREIGRLETSLKAAGEHEKLVFLHYPPLYQGYRCPEILRLLKEYGVKLCCYGHLHGASHRRAIEGMWDGTEFSLVSADYLKFVPKKICE